MPNLIHHVIRLRPGEPLKESIAKFATQQDIQAGWIVSAVGSLTDVHLRFANQETGFSESGHFEILSLSGTIAVSGMHLHMSVGDSLGAVRGGHLLDGNVVYTTAEIVIAEDQSKRFSREVDTTFGYRELMVD